jgi:hypothetical protein
MWHIDIQAAQAACMPSFGSLGLEVIIYIQAVVTGSTSEICSTPAWTSLRRERRISWWVCKKGARLGLWPDQSNGENKRSFPTLYLLHAIATVWARAPHLSILLLNLLNPFLLLLTHLHWCWMQRGSMKCHTFLPACMAWKPGTYKYVPLWEVQTSIIWRSWRREVLQTT